MSYQPSQSTFNYVVRPLRRTDSDLLRLCAMPNRPHPLICKLPSQWVWILTRSKGAVLPALILGVGLYLIQIWFLSQSWIPNSNTLIIWSWVGWLCIVGIFLWIRLVVPSQQLKFYWVVEYQERFIAYAVLKSNHSFSVLEWLQVYPKWRKKGIGSAITRTFIQRSPHPIYVNSTIWSANFYRKLGFRDIKVRDLPKESQKAMTFEGIAKLMIYD